MSEVPRYFKPRSSLPGNAAFPALAQQRFEREGGKACLSIRKHDHVTPTREIRRHVRALARNLYLSRSRPDPGRERALYRQPTGPNHFIIVMIRWTGLAPWEFEFPFPCSLTSTFLVTQAIS